MHMKDERFFHKRHVGHALATGVARHWGWRTDLVVGGTRAGELTVCVCVCEGDLTSVLSLDFHLHRLCV